MLPVDFQLSWHDSTDYPEWGSAPQRPLVAFDSAHKGEWMDSVIGPHPRTGHDMVYQVVRCELCILTHIWPIPSETDLAVFYQRAFYQHEKPDMIERYEADAAWWAQCMHGPMLDAAAAALQTSVLYAPSILDIGAGPGLLLQQAQARGWFTYAIEPSPLCATRLKAARHGVYEGTLPGYMDWDMSPREAFDIVTLWETVEHMSYPEEALLNVYDLLKPGGVLAVCVPNEYSSGALEAMRRYQLPPWFLAPPQHISYFSPATLKLMLRRCGFKMSYARMTYPMIEEFMLKEGLCYVGNDTLGRACHSRRMQFELDMVHTGRWPELEAQYRANVEDRVGREIVMICTKEC